MSTLTINNAVKPTLPTKTHCYSGRWECEDSVHNCPGMCGYVRYKDKYGNIVEESGFCITDTNIQIVASEIIQVIGLNTKVCSGTQRTIGVGNHTCNGICGFKKTGTATVYTQSSGQYIQDGEILYSDSAMTIPYSGSSFVKFNDGFGDAVFNVIIGSGTSSDGTVTLECRIGGGC